MAERVDWHRYFMNIAAEVARRATCPRKHVGAVIVRDRRILSTGYNGSLRGLPHCDEVGCLMEDGHCIATVHAEANAILQAAMNGVRIEGGEIYTTASPCWPCFKLIANSGLTGVYFGEFYREQRIHDYAEQAGITLTDLSRAQLPESPLPSRAKSPPRIPRSASARRGRAGRNGSRSRGRAPRSGG